MRFFFYGTLMAGSDNPVARFVHARLRAVGPARVRGVLHAVPDSDGWYPALLAGEDVGEGEAQGMLYEAGDDFAPADLARLDAYEDYDPARAQASLYVRETVEVAGPDGRVLLAQAYRFNQPLPEGARAIPGGNFREWLAAQGFEQFRGLRES